MKKIIIFLSVFAIFSCKKENDKPKVSYKKSSKPIEKQVDTTTIKVADLPIQFDGTQYLIFPIGNLNVANDNYSKFEISSNDETPSFSISNNMDAEITGYLTNLKFQKIDSEEFTVLTDKPILLESTTFLKEFAKKSKTQILVHQLADNDSNDDGKLDTNDIKALYLSDISGAKFTKISTDFQEVINWKLILSKNRLYYKTIEDTNKNGKFDKADKLHYNFVNLLDKDWKTVEYMPI